MAQRASHACTGSDRAAAPGASGPACSRVTDCRGVSASQVRPSHARSSRSACSTSGRARSAIHVLDAQEQTPAFCPRRQPRTGKRTTLPRCSNPEGVGARRPTVIAGLRQSAIGLRDHCAIDARRAVCRCERSAFGVLSLLQWTRASVDAHLHTQGRRWDDGARWRPAGREGRTPRGDVRHRRRTELGDRPRPGQRTRAPSERGPAHHPERALSPRLRPVLPGGRQDRLQDPADRDTACGGTRAPDGRAERDRRAARELRPAWRCRPAPPICTSRAPSAAVPNARRSRSHAARRSGRS